MSMYVAPEGGLHLRLVVYMSTKYNLLFSFIFRAWSEVIQIGAIISASQITCSGVFCFFCFCFKKNPYYNFFRIDKSRDRPIIVDSLSFTYS